MRSLPSALAPLGAYRQFILYRIVPSATRPGKTDKLPCDWRTGNVVTAHDPQYWCGFAAAADAAARLGLGIGFVFTANDPFWFCDVDGAWDGSAWSPVAQQLCQIFQGAAVEVSQSGTGLHLFGTGTVPPHGTRLKRLGLEFYTSGRFVALTGSQAIGDAGKDFSAIMPSFVAQWFPPGAEYEPFPTWTTEPVPEWRGPTNDDDLIRRGLISTGLSAFGGATFADLWQCNVDVLARAYPADPGSELAYGASEADSALASHLLFWTGKNHERTRELMKRSALVRSKWDREDYLERTILAASGVVRSVCVDKPLQAVAASESAVAADFTGRTFIPSSELPQIFAGCVYVQDNNAILLPSGDLVDQGRFNVRYGGIAFCLDAENDKIAKHAWDAYTNNRVVRLPRADTTCFRPDLPFEEFVEDQGRMQVNVYKAPVVARRPGDPAPFINHIKKLLPHGDDALILLSYLCAVVQHPGYKFRWAPFVQGTEGNGKGLLIEALIRAIGDKYVFLIGPDMIAKGFNAWAENNVLYVADDISRNGNREAMMDGLRRYITETRHPVEYKGIDATNKKICGNWLITDNHADLVRITDSSRRVCALYCAQQHAHQLAPAGLTPQYFNEYFIPWLENGGYEIVAEYLHTEPIDPRYNPAGLCQRAPLTTSTEQAVSDGKTLIESDLADWIENGEPGFAGGFISVNMLKKRLDKQPSVVKIRQMLGAIGYVQAGRVSRKVHPDEMQPVIYIRAGLVVADLAAEYEAAQLRGSFNA